MLASKVSIQNIHHNLVSFMPNMANRADAGYSAILLWHLSGSAHWQRWASMGYRRRYHAGHPLPPLSLGCALPIFRPCQSQPSTHSQRHRECRIYQAIQLRFGALHHQPNPSISVVKFRTSVPPFTPNHSLVRTGLYGAWLLSWSWSWESFIQLLGGILIGVKLRTEFCHRTIPFLASFKRFARPEFYLRVIYPFNRSPLQGIFFGC